MKNFFQLTIILIFINLISATNGQIYSYKEDPFKQLQELLPSPNDNRLASGAPGPGYWQQKADYHIKVTLDDEKQVTKVIFAIYLLSSAAFTRNQS